MLAVAFLRSQGSDLFEIRGVVSELGLDTGIAGAQVTVYQFAEETRDQATERTVFGTATTDAQGGFQFHPTHEGNFYVEVKKPPYVAVGHWESRTQAAPRGSAAPLPEQTGTLVAISHEHSILQTPIWTQRISEE